MKTILLFLLHITLLSSLASAATPTPRPFPIIEPICSNNYKPVCASLSDGKLVTFANMCKLEHTTIPDTIEFKYKGVCSPIDIYKNTDKLLICDRQVVSTIAHDIVINNTNSKVDSLYPGYTYQLSNNDAITNISTVGINPVSIQFIDSYGNLKKSVHIDGEGTWHSDLGTIVFSPEYNEEIQNETNLTISSTIQYVINNNCDYKKGLSKPAEISIEVNASKQAMIGFGIGQCFSTFSTVDAIDDNVLLEKNEKMKIISVLNNDNNYASATNFLFPSLRLLDKNNQIKRKIFIENEGTWLANTNTGKVIFVPQKGFKGSSEIKYAIHSKCSYQYQPDSYSDASKATISINRVTPTPTPTPKIIYIKVTPIPTPTATPKPKPTTIKKRKPTTSPTQPAETNTTSTPVVKSSNGSALGSLSLLALMIFTGMIGFFGMRREEV